MSSLSIPFGDFPDSSLLSGWLPLDKTLGAYLLGTFCGLILYGLSVHQLYRYYRSFSSDAISIRLLVTVVMILETLHTIMTMHTCYFYLVSNYFNFTALLQGAWSLNALPIVLSATMFSSQLFFAIRVFLIGPRYRLLVGIAVFFLIGELGFSLVITVRAFKVPLLLDLSTDGWLVATTFGMAFAADTMFTATLILVLRQSRAGQTRNDSVLDLIMLYVVNTGLLHCVFNGVAMIISCISVESLIYASFSIIAARLYSNNLLAVLNSRDEMAKKGMDFFANDANPSYGLNFIARATRQAAVETWNVPQVSDEPTVIDIKVTTENEGWEREFRLGKRMTATV